MESNSKVKIRDFAKDLKAEPSDLINIVNNYLDSDKKVGGSLSGAELDIVLEKLTQDNQVASFDSYIEVGEKKRREEKEKAEQAALEAKKAEEEKKKAEEEKKKAEEAKKKAEQAAIEAKKAEEAKKAQQEKKAKAAEAAKKAQEVKKPEPVKQQASQSKNRDKTDTKPQKQDKPDAVKQNPQNNPKPSADNTPKTANQNKPEKTKLPKIPPKQTAAKVDISTIKTNEPPVAKKKEKGEVTVQRHGEQVTKHVDTRGSYVDLDKYNEKYESIATQSSKRGGDLTGRKQKLSQKSQQKKGQYNKNVRETEAQKLKRLELERARKQQLKVQIPDEIVVSELASRLKVNATEVIKQLMKLGEMCTINQVIDFDTAALVADELGAKVEKEVIVTIEERLFDEEEDKDENLEPRSPVVVVMGHVDHGKTSILDYIRNAHVAAGEAGGITQHIGAYRVTAGGKDITFLDTPGHEAFTAMRARGAQITDIAILVVAADDGIMPQTVEAIHHAKDAGVSIIVAINKIDKPGANVERIKQTLTEYELVCEEWGGDTICVPVSAKTGEGMDNLLEMVNLTADVMELKANPNRLAKGAVVEARLDKGKGPIATLLVQNGTLHSGDIIIAGTSVGHVRVMRDDKGRTIKEAGPSDPVEVMGLGEVPSAGDTFAVVEDEKLARELVEKRKYEEKEAQFSLYKKVTLDNLFDQIEEGEMKELRIIVKADVQGSVEAVKQSLEKLSNNEVRVRVIHGGVGAVSESDVMLASASNAIIVGFNVRPNPAAEENAKRDGVDLRMYRIIYDAIEEIQTAMKGMLAPKYREVMLGKAEVRMTYKITGVGAVAGCYVLDGKLQRSAMIRVVRDGIIVADDKIAGLKRFKDDAKEVAQGFECGVSLEKFSDLKEGDIFECYYMEEYRD